MKRIVLMLITVAAMNVDEARAETKTLDLRDFDEISIRSAIVASVNQGDTYRVVATGASEDLERLEVKRRGRRLEFSTESGFWRWFGSGRIRLDITLPALQRLELSGSSEASLAMQIGSNPFSARLSGSSRLNGRLGCGDVDLGLSGSSSAALSGAGQRLSLGGSGSSRYDLKDFTVASVNARLSGASDAAVRLNGELNASLSGASDVIYYGNATLGSIRTSGASKVRKGQ